MVMQELIEAEATKEVGAGRYERSESRVNERNGSRARLRSIMRCSTKCCAYIRLERGVGRSCLKAELRC